IDLSRLTLYNKSTPGFDIILVPQEPHFWSRSIIDNFHFSYPQVTFEQIVKACEIAGADSFISELPDKYQTVLGEFGANLSGGQRQRLAIARAIVTDPPVLILDESTGALDPVSEAQVLDQLLSSRQGKTTIMISHRPKVIQRANWIIMLEKGKLQIQGTPEELHSLAGDHLDFLDDFVPSTKNLVMLASGSDSSVNGTSLNGNYSSSQFGDIPRPGF
ncbi:ATP-binding cassette domain-containing protein, partial [Moorena bouillonii]|uniref:ATP-binding cassette domain-containing protein n=1 Tax=Moorena bouillonii TaxID=207920 RepID=UPI00117E0910